MNSPGYELGERRGCQRGNHRLWCRYRVCVSAPHDDDDHHRLRVGGRARWLTPTSTTRRPPPGRAFFFVVELSRIARPVLAHQL